MKQVINSNIVKDLPWFKTWFNSPYYHSLYKNRNDEEARNFIDALLYELCPAQGSSMLDVGCGNGRHSKYLAAQGFKVTGFDTASSSIRQAQKFQLPTLTFFRHDMRLPFEKTGLTMCLIFLHIWLFQQQRKFIRTAEHAPGIKSWWQTGD